MADFIGSVLGPRAMKRIESADTIRSSLTYSHLLSWHEAMLPWVKKFNPYDLYSKGAARPDVGQLKPYYEGLIAELFPDKIAW